ncbi:MAG: 16S rRNA (cytosine(1402)-N(4))-methyltransferase RsmH [Candidatus Saccharimonadales bacterium]
MKHIPPQQLQSPSADGDEKTIHIPVLLEDAIALLAPKTGETYLDLTAGYGGHAQAIIDIVGASNATLVDRDQNAIDHLERFASEGARVEKNDFATYAEHCAEQGEQFNMVLVDLGVSSPQLDIATRGFSIKRDGPLDMRMDESGAVTASDIINRASEKELARIIERYGEERRRTAQKIAYAIRINRPIRTTFKLAEVILAQHRGAYQKVHPATRTFQAIRIAVNKELEQLERLLAVMPQLLMPGGRIAIISFHSLEDRLVKQYFQEQAAAGYEASLSLLTKKPIRGVTHDVHNPRARSATLRAAVKI